MRDERRKYLSLFFGLILISLILTLLIVIFLSESRFSRTFRRGVESFLPYQFRTVQSESGGCISIFFSPCSEADPDGIDDKLVGFINSAQIEIKAAIYSLDLDNVTNAFINAKSKGVRVCIVYDASNSLNDIAQIINSGIDVVFRPEGGGFMHNKFIVVDGIKTWTGSFNFTRSGAYKDNNNALLINSKKISQNYISEFDEMVQRKFGRNSFSKTTYPRLFIDGIEIETYFAPEDGVEDEIVRELSKARDEIVFMAFSFTSDRIARLMVEKIKTGVKLNGVFEKNQNSRYTEYQYLKDSGADVRWDTNSYNMHHKVIVIDRSVTITGSYNFSKRANMENDENCIIIHDKKIAEEFFREYERLVN